MTEYEPVFRYWVVEKVLGGWECRRKTNWRWVAYRHARRMSKRGYRFRVEERRGE